MLPALQIGLCSPADVAPVLAGNHMHLPVAAQPGAYLCVARDSRTRRDRRTSRCARRAVSIVSTLPNRFWGAPTFRVLPEPEFAGQDIFPGATVEGRLSGKYLPKELVDEAVLVYDGAYFALK